MRRTGLSRLRGNWRERGLVAGGYSGGERADECVHGHRIRDGDWLDCCGGDRVSTLLYRAEVGSHAYGTNTEFSDHDYVEVYIEGSEYVTGLSEWRTTHDSNDGRTPVGGEDTTVYGFKKWAHLVAQGNPNMIETLFIPNQAMPGKAWGNPETPEETVVRRSWNLIQSDRRAFVSKSAGRRFLGYAQSQLLALTGVRNKRTNRPELVHTHGYDTKYGGHIIRVLGEGAQLMVTGELTFPLDPEIRETIRDIRAGRMSKEDCLDMADYMRRSLEDEIARSALPEKADYKTINRLMHDVYGAAWGLR